MSAVRSAAGAVGLDFGFAPRAAEASRRLKGALAERRTFLVFVLSVAAVNGASLLGNVLALRWIEPAAMGVWHSLLLAGSYLAIVRFGIINGMGRELPFAIGGGDLDRARRIGATCLGWTLASSVLVGVAFLVPLAFAPFSSPAWRLALPAMAVVAAANVYQAYVRATLRSDSDFADLTRIQWLQAGIVLLLPFMVWAFGFGGFCSHAALLAVLVAGFAHRVRPLRVGIRFEPEVARQLMLTGLPLYLASYLQTVAMGFDRVILLSRGTVETLGYYAPAVAVLNAMAVVPGAVSTWIYPRMSHALGRGCRGAALRRMAFGGVAASLVVGLLPLVAGWFLAPAVITRLFPRYVASIPAVRWSLVAGLLWSLSPAATLLGSLKAWRLLSLHIGLTFCARWTFPWLLSGTHPPLEGVAIGNACAAALVGAVSLVLVLRATRSRGVPA